MLRLHWGTVCVWCLFSSSVQKPYDCVGVKFAVYSYRTLREALLFSAGAERGMCSLIGAPFKLPIITSYVCFVTTMSWCRCLVEEGVLQGCPECCPPPSSCLPRSQRGGRGNDLFFVFGAASVFTSFSFGRRGWVFLILLISAWGQERVITRCLVSLVSPPPPQLWRST